MKVKRKDSKERSEKFPAGRPIQDLLPSFLKSIERGKNNNGSQIEEVWAKLIGEKMIPFTRIQTLHEGVLFVQVSSPTLLNLLALKEKPRLLKALQQELPHLQIKTIVFRR